MATDARARTGVRRMTPNDLVAAQALSSEQKWPHRVEDWEIMLGLGFGYVAESKSGVVGTAMAWRFGAHAARIGMVIVTAKEQRRGIGRELMETLLAELGDRTVRLNATEPGLPLYRSLGFVEDGMILQHQGAALPVPVADLIPDERVRPLGSKDMPMLRSLTQRATGMDRDALLEALVPGAQGIMLTRSNDPVGFSLFRRFGRGYVVGPTIAPDLGGAKALISHWLGSKSGVFCRVDVPDECGLPVWLDALGLPCVGRVVRMYRGSTLPVDPSATVFSLTTQALG